MIIDNTLVVVPARGGSKRIPSKNIKMICGQPMIYWPLKELSKSFESDRIMVSTDDDDIVRMVQAKGLKVPFRRPAELSDDHTGTMDVVTHALNWYEDHVAPVDYVLIVYPTAVLLQTTDIEAAYVKLVGDENCDAVFSATSFPFPIQRAVFEGEDQYVEMFQPQNFDTRSQDLTEALHDAGQFYFCRSDTVRQSLNFGNSRWKVQKLHRDKVADIDTLEDFEIAESKMKMLGFEDADMAWSFD